MIRSASLVSSAPCSMASWVVRLPSSSALDRGQPAPHLHHQLAVGLTFERERGHGGDATPADEPRLHGAGPAQLAEGSAGWLANQATSPGWRRRTAAHRPSGSVGRDVARRGVDRPPGPLGELVLELARRPAGRPGEEAQAGPAGLAVAGRRWRSTVPQSPTTGRSRASVVDAAAARCRPRRSVPDRAADEHHARGGDLAGPLGRHLGHRRVARPVEDHAERAVGAVGEQQDDGPLEVRVADQRGGHQQAPGVAHRHDGRARVVRRGRSRHVAHRSRR